MNTKPIATTQGGSELTEIGELPTKQQIIIGIYHVNEESIEGNVRIIIDVKGINQADISPIIQINDQPLINIPRISIPEPIAHTEDIGGIYEHQRHIGA